MAANDTADTGITGDDEVARNAALVASRLQQRGIEVRDDDDDDPEALALLLEAVERFEARVEALGGDLMMDEPPAGGEPQPDDARFLLPVRRGGESIEAFRVRILDALPLDPA